MLGSRIIGQNLSIGGLSVSSRYDRDAKFGYLSLDIGPDAPLDQIKVAAGMLRNFADELDAPDEAVTI